MGTSSRLSPLASGIALVALLGMTLMLLALVGRPLATADLWFHLKMGEWATGAFVTLSWLRLMQDRPDRWSIASLLILYRLVLEPGRPLSRGSLIGAGVVLLLWANAHSLFAIGLALIGVAMVGRAFEAQLSAQVRSQEAVDWTPAKTLLGLLVACFVLTLLNPRGIWQHLTFFTSSANTAVWAVSDEWLAFYPFAPGSPNSVVLPWLTWLVADVVLVGFVVALGVGYAHLRKHRSADAIRALDPTLMLLGIVSIGALLVSFRFLWLGLFPILFMLRVRREVGGASQASGDRRATASAFAAAGLTCALLMAWPTESGAWGRHMSDVPEDTDTYLSTAVNHQRYAGEGVAFLKAAGAQGNLFNNYTVGAYTGFQLAPACRTFIDGRAEHYPPEVMIDYDVITAGTQRSDGRHFLDVLDDRQVSVFFGVGGPGYGYHADNTMHHLEAVPWWMLVFRSAGHGVWLRQSDAESDNLDRIEAYYREKGLPFSRENGLDVGAVIRDHLDYALEIRLVPPEYPAKLELSRSGDLDTRLNALAWLGDRHRLAGDYRGALAAYAQILRVNPRIPYVVEQSLRSLVAVGDFEAARGLFAQAQQAGMPAEQLAALEQLIVGQFDWRAALSSWGQPQ